MPRVQLKVNLNISIEYVPEPKKVEEKVIPSPIGPMNNFPDKHLACRYIYGDVKRGVWMCCGHPTTRVPYCDDHRAVCFDKERSARR